jgi:Ribosomal protein L30E
MINVDRALRNSIRTGKVLLGSSQALNAGISEQAKLLIYATDCPLAMSSQLDDLDVPIYSYPSGGRELGSACGKPFYVAALAIIEPGESDIMALLREIRGVENE